MLLVHGLPKASIGQAVSYPAPGCVRPSAERPCFFSTLGQFAMPPYLDRITHNEELLLRQLLFWQCMSQYWWKRWHEKRSPGYPANGLVLTKASHALVR